MLSENKPLIIEKVGLGAYYGGYSCLSSAACFSVFYGWLMHGRRKGPALPKAGPARSMLGLVCTS